MRLMPLCSLPFVWSYTVFGSHTSPHGASTTSCTLAEDHPVYRTCYPDSRLAGSLELQIARICLVASIQSYVFEEHTVFLSSGNGMTRHTCLAVCAPKPHLPAYQSFFPISNLRPREGSHDQYAVYIYRHFLLSILTTLKNLSCLPKISTSCQEHHTHHLIYFFTL